MLRRKNFENICQANENINVSNSCTLATSVLIKRQPLDVPDFEQGPENLKTSKMALAIRNLLPPSIYYKVLIFNAIKYLSHFLSLLRGASLRIHVSSGKLCMLF